MQMLMLYDRDEKLVASLKYNKVERKRELNGLNTLEFETSREVEFGQRTLFKDKKGLWNEYIIFDYFKNHENNDVTYSVYCEDSTSELYWYFVDDLKPRNEACSSILRRILEGTRFEVGYVDDFPKKSFNLYRESVKSCLWKILDVYGAEINVRIVVDKTGIIHRYIDLRNKIGRDVGKRFTYKKDIGSIKKTTSIKDLCTALHGYGKGEEIVKEDGTPSRNYNKIGGGDYGRKIDFSEINGGKTYVEDNEARLKYGLGKERKHIFGQAEFSDCEDKHELLRLTKEKLKELSKPKITYELKVEDISRYDGYIGEGVDLGDTVYVIDKEIDTRVQTRVISIKDNPIEEIEDSEIVLGNFIKDLSDNLVAYEKLKSTFENDRNKFNQELDKLANGVKSSYMQKILEKFNKELNETGGWVYAEEGEGLLILNAPKEGNPTQAINLKGGKIAIANHKNADGSFAYETFGDGDGFTANLIRAGVLRGGKVFFNLEDGTLLIGNSPDDYNLYWDGGTLHLRNTDIDLSNNVDIDDMKKSISLKVSRGDIISEINQSPEQVKINAGKIDLEGNSINVKGTFQTLNSDDDVGIKIDYNQIHFQDNRRQGYRFGMINVNKLWYKDRAFSLNLGHYQEGFLSVGWYKDDWKEWEPYMVFDRWGKSTYATEGYSIRVLDTINFDKTALFKGNVVINNSTTFNDECKFERNITFGGNRIKIVNYSDGLGFVNGNGEGLFIEGSGAVYLMDTQYKYRVAKE